MIKLNQTLQPLDLDLEAFAAGTPATALGDSTAQANRRGMIGAVGTALEITTALQGAEADPTRIGTEYMPLTLDVDYIVVGEAGAEAELPEGGLARIDGELVMYDAGGNPVPVGGTGQENVVPYHRASGVATIVPFGVTNSPAKQANTYYWQEIARVKVPASELVDGNTLQLGADITIDSNVAIPLLKGVMRIVPQKVWDAADQTAYFGASPVSIAFTGAVAINELSFYVSNFVSTTCKKAVSQFRRSHILSVITDTLGIADAAAGVSTTGYDITNAAAFTSNGTTGKTFTHTVGTDLELVLVACVTATAADFRTYGYTFTASAAP